MVIGIAILLTAGFTLVSAIVDVEHINKKQYIDNHTSRWVLRFMFCAVIGLINWKLFFASGLLFAALFDHLINILRDKPFWYLGKVAKWDVFWNRRKYLYIFINGFMMSMSIYLFLNAI